MGLWTGIRSHGRGWQAWVSVRRARDSKTFPPDTSPELMQAWRDQRRAELVLEKGRKPSSGTFAHDAIRYLQAVKALPTFQERQFHILEWVQVFGVLPRHRITPADIRRQRDLWLTTPRKVKGKMLPPLAPNTVNKRLRALSNLWTVLDGKRAENPVREVPEALEAHAPPRAIPYPLIERILNALPDLGRAPKGEKRPTASQTKARLLVMAWTGLPPKVIGQIRPEDVQPADGTVRVWGRQKGTGTRGAILPLLPEALEAFQLMADTHAWGPYSASSVRKSFARACAKVKGELVKEGVPVGQAGVLDTLRPYDLRHSFATVALRQSGNLRGVSRLLLHADLRTTLRYTEAAVDPLAVSVLEHFRSAPVRPPGTPEAQKP
jgi:integrase